MLAGPPESPPAPPPEERPARRRPRGRWVVTALVAALLVTIAAPGALWVVANRDASRAAMRDRVEEALRARLPGARVGPSLSVDSRFRLRFGPVTIPAVRRGAPPVLTVKEVRVRPRWRALLAGRLEASVVSLDGVTVETGRRGEELRALVQKLKDARGSATGTARGEAREPPRLRVDGLLLRGPALGARAIEVGPLGAEARLERDGTSRSIRFRVRVPGRGAIDGTLSRAADGASLTAHVEHLTREALPDAIRRRLPLELAGGTLRGEIEAERLSAEGGAFSWDLRASDVAVSSPRLAAEAVGPVDVVSRGRASFDAAALRLRVDEAEVRLGGDARLAAAVALQIAGKPPRQVDLRVEAPALDFALLARSLPHQLAPGPDAPRVHGTFGFELHVRGPLQDPSRWALDASVDLSSLARDRGETSLQGSFRHEAQLTGGSTREVVVGPQSPSFVSIATLPQHVVRAITTAEDAAFWSHDGFDFQELQDAIAAGARRGEFGRGASTISQQVAKNLWLGRERTLARKAREALLTVALEASLPKRRILEVYVNVAEWGPGIVGLGEAARHYFGKDARDLTPKEAAFLASIIPNPIRYHVYCSRGELSPAWEARVDELLTKLWSSGVLTSEELDAARAERLVFTHGA